MDIFLLYLFTRVNALIRLAAAIRKGAKMRPQVSGTFFERGGSCAMGATYEGKTGETLPEGITDPWKLQEAWPCFFNDANEFNFSELGNKIMKLNDSGQTREQIADWLETLEPRISDAEFTARFISEVVESEKSQEVAEVK